MQVWALFIFSASSFDWFLLNISSLEYLEIDQKTNCHLQVYDMQFELNEIEARREYYPSTISFINLLNALIAEERDFSDRGRR